MDLFDKISADIKSAMLARGIKKEFLEAKTAKGGDGSLSDEAATKILAKMAKQRRETAQIYDEQNRLDLRDNELAEAAVIEEYPPTQVLTADLRKIIAEVGATSPKEMGKVMGVASKTLAGRADGKVISAKVRELLA